MQNTQHQTPLGQRWNSKGKAEYWRGYKAHPTKIGLDRFSSPSYLCCYW